MDQPNPGSNAALDLGCRCPVLDNGHGAGVRTADGARLFWIAEDCPLHGSGQNAPMCETTTAPRATVSADDNAQGEAA